MTDTRPFTPELLADRWQCSSETIRQMVKRGDLRGFRVGRMIRIPLDAVEELECQTSTSVASEADIASTGATLKQADEHVTVLRHAPERKRKRKA
ncbi:helix-turn-helix domain-containing protein [Pseudooceanicola sp. 502str34]